MWEWKIVWPASAPTFTLTLKPVTSGTFELFGPACRTTAARRHCARAGAGRTSRIRGAWERSGCAAPSLDVRRGSRNKVRYLQRSGHQAYHRTSIRLGALGRIGYASEISVVTIPLGCIAGVAKRLKIEVVVCAATVSGDDVIDFQGFLLSRNPAKCTMEVCLLKNLVAQRAGQIAVSLSWCDHGSARFVEIGFDLPSACP